MGRLRVAPERVSEYFPVDEVRHSSDHGVITLT
jgi:hypothetical protein